MHEIQKGADAMKNQLKEKMLSLVIPKRITGMQQHSWRSDPHRPQGRIWQMRNIWRCWRDWKRKCSWKS